MKSCTFARNVKDFDFRSHWHLFLLPVNRRFVDPRGQINSKHGPPGAKPCSLSFYLFFTATKWSPWVCFHWYLPSSSVTQRHVVLFGSVKLHPVIPKHKQPACFSVCVGHVWIDARWAKATYLFINFYWKTKKKKKQTKDSNVPIERRKKRTKRKKVIEFGERSSYVQHIALEKEQTPPVLHLRGRLRVRLENSSSRHRAGQRQHSRHSSNPTK